MKLSTSLSDFGEFAPLQTPRIALFGDSKFKYFNISIGGDMYTCDDEDAWKIRSTEWKNALDAIGRQAVIAHAPGTNPFGKGKEHYEQCVKVLKRVIRGAEILGVKDLVVHAGFSSTFTGYEFMKENKRFYRDILDTAAECDVHILTENMDSFTYYPLSTGAEMRELIEFIDHPYMGACWDTAHANINKKVKREGDQYKSIVAMGDKLRGLHVADNFGAETQHHHSWPFAGNINWDSVMQGLVDIDYKGYFNYEASYTLQHHAHPHNGRKPFEHNGETITKLYDPSFELKKQAVDLIYEVGKHILTTYDVFEE